jgi:hypothetical protein
LRDHRAFPAVLGLQAIRRLATTPVIPANLLIVQLAINVAVVILGTGLLLVVGAAVFDIPVPQDPVGFLAAFLLGTGSVFSLGLLAVAIARTSRSVVGLVLVAYLPIMILGGVYLPHSSCLTSSSGHPPGVEALQDAGRRTQDAGRTDWHRPATAAAGRAGSVEPGCQLVGRQVGSLGVTAFRQFGDDHRFLLSG